RRTSVMAASASSDGTAASGVPMKTVSVTTDQRGPGDVGNPGLWTEVCAGCGPENDHASQTESLLAQLLQHLFPFSAVQLVDDEDSVQMLVLVLQHAAHQFVALVDHLFAVLVESADLGIGRPGDLPPVAGHRQASLLELPGPFGFHEFGVDHRSSSASVARVEHSDPQPDSDLGGRQSHAGGLVHRLDHVSDQLADLVVYLRHRLGRCPQYRIAERTNGEDRHGRRVPTWCPSEETSRPYAHGFRVR